MTFSDCTRNEPGGPDDPGGNTEPKQTTEPVELTSPIRENTTLKDLGLDVDYIYAGNGLLVVENNATLTIEPGVTIQFTHQYRSGGIEIRAGATIKAIGTASKRIKFTGAYNEKGTWERVLIQSNTDNQFVYCDFENIGNLDRYDYSGITLYNGKVGLSYCKLSGGLGTGLAVSGNSQISAFDNNVFEDFDLAPVYTTQGKCLKVLEKFDMTSNFTNNNFPYIQIYDADMDENVTLNQTTVPYYFYTTGNSTLNLNHILTINEGVTIYMGAGQSINGGTGRLMVNGTASKKVTFTRMPGETYYWYGLYFLSGLQGSTLNHCILEYGGKNSSNSAIIGVANATDLTLNHVEIRNSETYGVHIFTNNCNYKITHSNVTFSNNYSGNVYDGCANPSIVRSHFP
jgi:hypothetical protein